MNSISSAPAKKTEVLERVRAGADALAVLKTGVGCD
jgi:hypothetical protein